METHPCLKCGACCSFFRVSFHWSETLPESYGVPENRAISITPHLLAMKGTDQVVLRCESLQGTIGDHAFCTIYENRPSCCRKFEASYESGVPNKRCDEARKSKGLPALQKSDWSLR